MNDKIVILGWGSLLYELCDLKENIKLPWKDGGPKLPIEFSRVSKSRKGALTLVIDSINGVETHTKFIESKRKDPKDTACDLRNREKTIIRNIGIIDIQEGYKNFNCKNVAEVIEQWGKNNNIRAIVWTDLLPNFERESKLNKSFSVEVAIEYLKNLPEDGKEEAKTYIKNAPYFIDTPLKKKLKDINWC